MPPPSGTAFRFAAQWVADALAGDETLNFSVIKALVGVSPEFLTGAPEAARERVALRCLQEVVTIAVEGESAAVPEEAAGILRVDAARSCEDLLLELIGEVGRSGRLERDMLLPFRQDIQKFICIKKPTLPETSLELLREVYPDITLAGTLSPVEQNCNNKHDNDQSVSNISSDHVNAGNLGCPTDNAQLQQENIENLVNATDTTNVQKDPMDSTPDFHKPCKLDSRGYDHPEEDPIGGDGVKVSSPGKSPSNVYRNMSVAVEPASASCDVPLQESNTEIMSKQDAVDHSTITQPQSCGDKYPNSPHDNDGERPHDDGTNMQSSKDSIHEGPTMHATVLPDFDRSINDLPTNTSEPSHFPDFITEDDTAMIAEPHSSKTHPNSPQHDSGEKMNKDLDDGSARIQPVEKDLGHAELTLRTAGILPSGSWNGDILGDKSETDHLTEHIKTFVQNNGDKSHLDVSCANTVNEDLDDDGNIVKKDTVCGGQTTPESCCYNVALHTKTSDVNYLSDKNTGKSMSDILKSVRSVPNSPQGVNEKIAEKVSKKKIVGSTVPETSHVRSSDNSFSGFAAAGLMSMPFCTQDQDVNGSIEGQTEQDLCVKCGKDGQLLKCSNCLLAAHDSCFGSSVAFDGSGQFYCPVCFYAKAAEAYQKAKKTYSEARNNLSAFLGAKQFVKQHNDQPTGMQQRVANCDDHLNGCNTSKRQDNHQSEADNLSHKNEEPGRQRKKQKNATTTSDACPEDVVTEKASFGQNSDVAPMNKHCVLQNNRNQVEATEYEQSVENAEAGNGNLSHETRRSSHRCSPAANQNVDFDKNDGLTNPRQSEESDEIEATSSNDTGKRSSPPWRNMRHRKARFQEKETAVSSNSRKAFGRQGQHMPSPSRKRNYAPNRYSNPVAPTGRRTKLCWTEEEEAALREAMPKFTPKDDGPIPWIQILEYGRDAFHKTRLPCDLRVKWRNMTKKSGS